MKRPRSGVSRTAPPAERPQPRFVCLCPVKQRSTGFGTKPAAARRAHTGQGQDRLPSCPHSVWSSIHLLSEPFGSVVFPIAARKPPEPGRTKAWWADCTTPCAGCGVALVTHSRASLPWGPHFGRIRPLRRERNHAPHDPRRDRDEPAKKSFGAAHSAAWMYHAGGRW